MELTSKKNKEPLIRITKRKDIPLWEKIVIKATCLLVAFLISSLVIFLISKKNPFEAFLIMLDGTFQNKIKFWSTVQEFMLLFGIAVALAPSYKMRFWNVGAQGQVLIGGLLTAVVMIYFSSLPSALLIILSIIVSIIGGAIWGAIPAFFKAKWNTNETLFTLMMNYIAIQLVTLCTEIWRGGNSKMPLINSTNHQGWLPVIAKNSTILPLILIILIAVGMFFYINYSKQGYEIKVIGDSVNTAKYAGIKVKKVIIRTVAISGAICGFIGFIYVAGLNHSISSETSGGYGFTAIICGWLGNFNPLLMALYSFIIVFLKKGAKSLSNKVSFSKKLNEYSCEIIILIIILSFMISDFIIKYKIIFRKKKINTNSEFEVQNIEVQKEDKQNG